MHVDVEDFERTMHRGGKAAIREVSRFFMRKDPVHRALSAIARRLADLGVPYAVVGGMALVAHGYDRTTVDVDILVTSGGLEALRRGLLGRGYRPAFEGSRHLRDTETGVRIEFLVAGGFPGDGKPKPVAFPDPSDCRVSIDGVYYLTLPRLIDLKLASGMTHTGRLKDLADVQELIRTLRLGLALADELHPYVRDKYLELHSGLEEDQS